MVGKRTEVRGPGPLLAVYSPKGGVGTTVLSTGLALHLCRRAPTVLVEWGGAGGDLSTLLQAPRYPTLLDWPAESPLYPERHLIRHPTGLRLLPGPGRLVDRLDFTAPLATRLLGDIRRAGPHVVLDMHSSLSDATLVGLEQADAVLLLVTPDLLSLQACRRLMHELEPLGLTSQRCRLVINRTGRGLRYSLSIQEIRDLLPFPLVGEIPSHPGLSRSVNWGLAASALRGGPVGRSLSRLADNLESLGVAPRRRWPW